MDLSSNHLRGCIFIDGNSAATGSRITLDATLQISATGVINLLDNTGLVMASLSSGINWFRDMDPFTDAIYDMGNFTKAWDAGFFDGKLALFESFAAGTAPAAQTGWSQLFMRDNGSGKTQFRVKFQTGTSVLIATEP